jgi:hypothetical protein
MTLYTFTYNRKKTTMKKGPNSLGNAKKIFRKSVSHPPKRG